MENSPRRMNNRPAVQRNVGGYLDDAAVLSPVPPSPNRVSPKKNGISISSMLRSPALASSISTDHALSSSPKPHRQQQHFKKSSTDPTKKMIMMNQYQANENSYSNKNSIPSVIGSSNIQLSVSQLSLEFDSAEFSSRRESDTSNKSAASRRACSMNDVYDNEDDNSKGSSAAAPRAPRRRSTKIVVGLPSISSSLRAPRRRSTKIQPFTAPCFPSTPENDNEQQGTNENVETDDEDETTTPRNSSLRQSAISIGTFGSFDSNDFDDDIDDDDDDEEEVVDDDNFDFNVSAANLDIKCTEDINRKCSYSPAKQPRRLPTVMDTNTIAKHFDVNEADEENNESD